MEPFVTLFLRVYRSTRSFEAAILELKRAGCSQQQTVRIIAQMFHIDALHITEAVRPSLAWQQ